MMTRAKLEVTVQKMARGIAIEAVGDLDLTSIGTLELPLTESIQANIDATKAIPLSVDLRQVDFIDSAGLAFWWRRGSGSLPLSVPSRYC